MFVYGYYNRPVLWFQRRYSGPALVLIAVAYGLLNHSFDGLILSGLFALTGIYMILRPFIALTRMRFERSAGTIRVDESGITVTNELGNITFPRGKLLKVLRKGRYVFLKAQMNTKQYYSIDLKGIRDDADALVIEMEKLLAKGSQGL